MVRYRGIGPGFDLMRLGLALAIFYAHTNFALSPPASDVAFVGMTVTPNAGAAGLADGFSVGRFLSDIKSSLYGMMVPTFFALSGFLVTGSAIRTATVGRFLSFRMLRIFPALTVEVILSAIILGLIFSTLPFLDYITHPEFLRYFGNILGFVTFTLPGVFADNINPYLVNVNLWTLPAEFYCYLVMAALMMAGLVVRRHLFLGLFAVVTVLLIVLSFTEFVTPSILSTPVIVYFFFMGMAFFQLRDHVPMNPLLFALSIVTVLIMIRHPNMVFLIPVPLTYIMVYAGHIALLSIPALKDRDYSYGVYLYGFPITQAVVASVPGIDRMALLMIALPMTIAVAAFSWHWIEKPFLRLKRKPPPPHEATAGMTGHQRS